MSETSSPTLSPRSSLHNRRSSSKSSLTLDLSSLPALEQPVAPTNTLLITNLQSLDIFRPDNLETIRDLISKTAPIHTWAPLKCFRRIHVSFYSEEEALSVRSVWDGENIMGQRTRVYYGQPTPIRTAEEADRERHLALPDAGKLFFISPPPSPPHGWEMKLEDAPNKMVHADDLADALSKLRHQAGTTNIYAGDYSPISPVDGVPSRTRSRSSTLIFQPEEKDQSGKNLPAMPAIAVDDYTDEPEDFANNERTIMAHTSRPPVELMMVDA